MHGVCGAGALDDGIEKVLVSIREPPAAGNEFVCRQNVRSSDTDVFEAKTGKLLARYRISAMGTAADHAAALAECAFQQHTGRVKRGTTAAAREEFVLFGGFRHDQNANCFGR